MQILSRSNARLHPIKILPTSVYSPTTIAIVLESEEGNAMLSDIAIASIKYIRFSGDSIWQEATFRGTIDKDVQLVTISVTNYLSLSL